MTTPYITPVEYPTFGINPAVITDEMVLRATMLANTRMGRDLAVQVYLHTIEVTDQGYAIAPYTPIIAIDSCRGRCWPVSNHRKRRVYNRALEMQDDTMASYGAVVNVNGQPVWEDIDTALLVLNDTVNPRTGVINLPQSMWHMPYAEIELTYQSGYATIPDEVKMAVSLIARNFPLRPVANAKRIKSGMQEIEFKDYGPSFITPEADAILAKYVKGLVV